MNQNENIKSLKTLNEKQENIEDHSLPKKSSKHTFLQNEESNQNAPWYEKYVGIIIFICACFCYSLGTILCKYLYLEYPNLG